MCVYKNHAIIFRGRTPKWSGTIIFAVIMWFIFKLEKNNILSVVTTTQDTCLSNISWNRCRHECPTFPGTFYLLSHVSEHASTGSCLVGTKVHSLGFQPCLPSTAQVWPICGWHLHTNRQLCVIFLLAVISLRLLPIYLWAVKGLGGVSHWPFIPGYFQLGPIQSSASCERRRLASRLLMQH